MRGIRITLGLAVSGLLLLGVAPGAGAQNQLEVARQLRVEWVPGSDKWGPPRLVGYVYNDSTFRIGSVRLRVETLDGSDRMVGETLAWIYVNVPARDRAYFSVRRPSGGEVFRLTVESFVLIAREAPEQTPQATLSARAANRNSVIANNTAAGGGGIFNCLESQQSGGANHSSGYLSMFQTLRSQSGEDIKIFSTVADAHRWLGLEQPPPPDVDS